MLLRATIVVEFEAKSFVVAGHIQQKLEKHVETIKADGFPQAHLDIRETRARGPNEPRRTRVRLPPPK